MSAVTTKREEAVSANALEYSGVTLSTVDAEHCSEEDLIFDSIVSSAFEESFRQPSIGPNCLVLYQFALSEQFSVGPNGEIYSNDL